MNVASTSTTTHLSDEQILIANLEKKSIEFFDTNIVELAVAMYK